MSDVIRPRAVSCVCFMSRVAATRAVNDTADSVDGGNGDRCAPSMGEARPPALVATARSPLMTATPPAAARQGLTLVHFSGQRMHFLWESSGGFSSV